MFHTKVQTYENTPSSYPACLGLCVLRQSPALLGQRQPQSDDEYLMSVFWYKWIHLRAIITEL